jgi:hypothetical protein
MPSDPLFNEVPADLDRYNMLNGDFTSFAANPSDPSSPDPAKCLSSNADIKWEGHCYHHHILC